jgi:hypothetical protein
MADNNGGLGVAGGIYVSWLVLAIIGAVLIFGVVKARAR